MKRRKPAPRPPPLDKRMQPLLEAIFSRRGIPASGVVPPELAEALDKLTVAREHGFNRHTGQGTKGKGRDREARYDWRPIFDSLVAADRTVFLPPIKEKRVRAMLATLKQTDELEGVDTYCLAFIKWVRRGLKKRELELPPPVAGGGAPGEDGANM